MVTTPGMADIGLYDQHSPHAARLLREFHDSVLRPSFRPEEYVSPEVIKPGSRPAIIACAADGLVVGGALGHPYPDSGVLLLSYLAVRREFRGKGIGGAIMTALRENWLDPGALAVLEMDDPRYYAPHPDYGDPRARLRFYGAAGVRLLALPYVQPRLRAHLPRVHHMFLGVIPPTGETLPESIPSSRVSTFLREYFADSEGGVIDGDVEFTCLLGACAGPEINLVRTEDFSMVC